MVIEMSEKPIEQLLDEIEVYCSKATPGPWDFHGLSMSYHVARVLDGHFHMTPRIVHATIERDVYNPDDVERGAGGVRRMEDAVFIWFLRRGK